jgi:hypothetical protein
MSMVMNVVLCVTCFSMIYCTMSGVRMHIFIFIGC